MRLTPAQTDALRWVVDPLSALAAPRTDVLTRLIDADLITVDNGLALTTEGQIALADADATKTPEEYREAAYRKMRDAGEDPGRSVSLACGQCPRCGWPRALPCSECITATKKPAP